MYQKQKQFTQDLDANSNSTRTSNKVQINVRSNLLSETVTEETIQQLERFAST